MMANVKRISRNRGWLLFIAKRLAVLVVTLLATSFVVFSSLYLAPGNPVSVLLGRRTASPQTIAALNAQFHLSGPFLARYWAWLTSALQGNFGVSVISREPINQLLTARIGNTAFLVGYAAVLVLVGGTILGILAGLRKGKVRQGILGVSTLGVAIPPFVAAVFLEIAFAVQLRWLPAFGTGSGFLGRLEHLTLPAIALALSTTGLMIRITAIAIAEEQDREHVETATSRGLPRRLVIRRHVVRNALIPITTVTGLVIAGLLVGTTVIETVFGIDGIGAYLIQAVQAKDFAVVQAITLVLVTAFVFVSTVVDLLYGFLDPRIGPGAR